MQLILERVFPLPPPPISQPGLELLGEMAGSEALVFPPHRLFPFPLKPYLYTSFAHSTSFIFINYPLVSPALHTHLVRRAGRIMLRSLTILDVSFAPSGFLEFSNSSLVLGQRGRPQLHHSEDGHNGSSHILPLPGSNFNPALGVYRAAISFVVGSLAVTSYCVQCPRLSFSHILEVWQPVIINDGGLWQWYKPSTCG